jgi:hypothetical protein
MLGVIRITRVSGKGCEELGRMGLLDTSRCCKICPPRRHPGALSRGAP